MRSRRAPRPIAARTAARGCRCRVCGGRSNAPTTGWRLPTASCCVHIPHENRFTPPASHLGTHLSGPRPLGAPAGTFDAGRCGMRNVGPSTWLFTRRRVVENWWTRPSASPRRLAGADHARWRPGAGRPRRLRRQVATPGSLRRFSPAALVDRYELLSPTPAFTKLPGRAATATRSRCSSARWTRRRAASGCMALTDTTPATSRSRAFQHTIFTQDQPVLESQRPGACRWAAANLHCATDRRLLLPPSGATPESPLSVAELHRLRQDPPRSTARCCCAPCPPSCICIDIEGPARSPS